MRRFAAIALFVVLALPALLPLLAPSATALPACCRRDGQHHCSMTPASHAQGAGFRAILPACPFLSLAFTTAHTLGFNPASIATVLSLTLVALVAASTRRHFSESSYFTNLQRGPPALSC